MTATRRLAAILAADVAGYSRLIGAERKPLSKCLQLSRPILKYKGIQQIAAN
jgi:hypothetical protein